MLNRAQKNEEQPAIRVGFFELVKMPYTVCNVPSFINLDPPNLVCALCWCTCPVPLCHVQRHTDDGGGLLVRIAAWLSPASHAAGVRPAHWRLHRVRHWATRTEWRPQGVREQHHPVEKELHCSVQPVSTHKPVRYRPSQFNSRDVRTAGEQNMWVSGLWEIQYFICQNEI